MNNPNENNSIVWYKSDSPEKTPGKINSIINHIKSDSEIILVWLFWLFFIYMTAVVIWKKYFHVNINEIIQSVPGQIHAKLKCDGQEIYIKQTEWRIVCYTPWGKAKSYSIQTPGVTIPEIAWWNWKLSNKTTIGAKKLWEIDPWWNSKIKIIDGMTQIFEWTYGEYVKSLPWCSVTITFNWVTKVITSFDFEKFKKWQHEMDTCRNNI